MGLRITNCRNIPVYLFSAQSFTFISFAVSLQELSCLLKQVNRILEGKSSNLLTKGRVYEKVFEALSNGASTNEKGEIG